MLTRSQNFESLFKAGFHLGKISSGQERTGKFPSSCELSVGTNDSNTKETFLSVPVLRKVFLSGNQPLTIVVYFVSVRIFITWKVVKVKLAINLNLGKRYDELRTEKAKQSYRPTLRYFAISNRGINTINSS